MRTRRIRTKPDRPEDTVEISGWLCDAERTYLWFGYQGRCIGILSGEKLYRLAKAITRRWEAKP